MPMILSVDGSHVNTAIVKSRVDTHPFISTITILNLNPEFNKRPNAILNRNNNTLRSCAHSPTNMVLRIERASFPSTSVVKDHKRKFLAALRAAGWRCVHTNSHVICDLFVSSLNTGICGRKEFRCSG